MSNIKIALTGAHGVGKTTLATHLKEQLATTIGERVAMTPEVPRIICSIVANPQFFRREYNNALKQAMLLYGQLQFEQESLPENDGILICDRSLLDHWAYSTYLFEDVFREAGVLDVYESLVAQYCKTYRLMFYVPIEFLPIDDGTRESDPGFQASIDSIIAKFLNRYSITYMKITGNVESRSSAILSELQCLL